MAITAGSLITTGGKLFGGITSFASGMSEASLLSQQGEISRDDYYRQAQLIREQGARTRAKQSMDYVSAGVELAGTPLLVLRETLSRSMAEGAAYERTGRNVERLYNQKAKQTKNEGMGQLVGSVLSAAALLAL
jgi:hypothetical protein